MLVNELKRKKIESATSSSIVSILPSELIRCVLSSACKKCTWQLTNKPDRLCSPKSSRGVTTTPTFLCRPQRQTANSFRPRVPPTLDHVHLKLADWRGYYLHCGFKAFTLMSWRSIQVFSDRFLDSSGLCVVFWLSLNTVDVMWPHFFLFRPGGEHCGHETETHCESDGEDDDGPAELHKRWVSSLSQHSVKSTWECEWCELL